MSKVIQAFSMAAHQFDFIVIFLNLLQYYITSENTHMYTIVQSCYSMLTVQMYSYNKHGYQLLHH